MRGHINKVGNSWGFHLDVGKDSNGKRKQKRYGKFKTKKEAENACAEMIYKLEQEIFVEPKKWTIAQYLREWLETHKQKISENTYRGYKVNIENHIIPEIGGISLQKLQPHSLQILYSKLLNEKKLAPTSIQYIHSTLRKALQDALKVQYVNRNIAVLVDPPRKHKYEATFLNNAEIDKLLKGIKNTEFYIPTLIAVFLGLRRGEVLGLKWCDINVRKGLIIINRAYIATPTGDKISDLKTDKSHRTLAIPKNLMSKLMEERKRQSDEGLLLNKGQYAGNFICCDKNGILISPGNWYRNFKKALKENNLKDIRIHDLRHTNASLMMKAGVPMKVASERLGHASIGITMDLYSHIDVDMQRDAAEKINNIINLQKM